MKNFFLILLAATFSLILIVSTSRRLMKIVTEYRFHTSSIIQSLKYRYGDLYGVSYLPDFKINPNLGAGDVKLNDCSVDPSINLYIAGDSYLGKYFIEDGSVLCGVKNYYHLQYNAGDTMSVNLTKGERNVLLIETVERGVKGFIDSNYIVDKLMMHKRKEEDVKMNLETFSSWVKEILYNPSLEQNIEFNLFDYKMFLPFKEAKARFNYIFFNRVSDEVTVAPDKEYLLLRSTTDTLALGSSFYPVSNEEIEALVGSLNYVYDYYKANGFDEVYFTIAPNPVTVLYPEMGKYNELIPRVQNHPGLKMPVVDVYDIFRHTKHQIYSKTDTHWNANGLRLWLNEFNKVLSKDWKAGDVVKAASPESARP